MPVVELESVFSNLGNVVAKQIVDHTHGQNWLQVSFLVRFELLRAVKVDGQRRHLHERTASVPVSALQSGAILDDHFSSEGKVTVEPSPPQTASIGHHVELVVLSALFLASRGDLEAG